VIRTALQKTILSGMVTYDLARQMKNATEVSCSAFGKAVVEKIKNG